MLNELLRLVESLLRNIDGRVGQKLRYWYYRGRLGRCGKNVIIEPGVFFQGAKHIHIGDNVWIDRYAILIAGPFHSRGRKFLDKPNEFYEGAPGEMTLGNGTHIAPHTLLQAHGGLWIGQNVTVASGAKVYTLSHHYKNLLDPADQKRYSFSTMAPVEDQFLIMSPVVIGNQSAVGLNAVVLPGTTLRNGTWLGVLSHLQPGPSEEGVIYQSTRAVAKRSGI